MDLARFHLDDCHGHAAERPACGGHDTAHHALSRARTRGGRREKGNQQRRQSLVGSRVSSPDSPYRSALTAENASTHPGSQERRAGRGPVAACPLLLLADPTSA